jgi:hypothetical protein
VVFLVFLATVLAVATWQRSGDPLIDWGRELYSAMSVSRGLGIPEDVQLLFGSLSPLVNGAILHIAGEHMAAILLVNLAILATASVLVWWITERTFGRPAAFMTTLVWLFLSAYPHLVRVGNYNFLTPYSHGVTHGLTLGFLCVVCILQALKSEHVRWWIGAGFACGLALFSKPEAGLAASATLGAGLLIETVTEQRRLGRSAPAALGGLFLATGIMLPVALAAGGVPIDSHLAPYRSAANVLLKDLPYYGGGALRKSAVVPLLEGGAIFFVILAIVLLFERRVEMFFGPQGTRQSARWRIASIVAPVLAVVSCAAFAPFAWHRLAATLPWLCAAALISSIRTLSRALKTVESQQRIQAGKILILAVFAAGWLAKIGIAPRFDHYGFALTAPAVLLGIGMVTGDQRVGSDAGPGSLIRRQSIGSALALFLAISAASQSTAFYVKRTLAVGEGGSRMLIFHPSFDPRSTLFEELLGRLDASASFHAGAVILPEGGLFHVLLEEPSTIRAASLMPLEVLLLGSGHVVEMISRSEPALVVVAEPLLDGWMAASTATREPFTTMIEAVESLYCLTAESGDEATGPDHLHVRILSPCPVNDRGGHLRSSDIATPSGPPESRLP